MLSIHRTAGDGSPQHDLDVKIVSISIRLISFTVASQLWTVVMAHAAFSDHIFTAITTVLV